MTFAAHTIKTYTNGATGVSAEGMNAVETDLHDAGDEILRHETSGDHNAQYLGITAQAADSHTVDGKHAGTTADTVLLLNGAGKVPNANLLTGTGNGLDADTVDTRHAGATAGCLPILDAGAKLPIANMPSVSASGTSAFSQAIGDGGSWDKAITMSITAVTVFWFIDSTRWGWITTGGVNVCFSPGGENSMIVRNIRLSGTTLTLNLFNNTGFPTTFSGTVSWVAFY